MRAIRRSLDGTRDGPAGYGFRNLLTAVTDGVLFATDSADSIAFGLNAATGTVEWTYPSAG